MGKASVQNQTDEINLQIGINVGAIAFVGINA